MSRLATGEGHRVSGTCPACVANTALSGDIDDLTLAIRALTAEIRILRTCAPQVSASGQAPARHFSARVKRAAAQVRVKVDREAGRPTPSWIRELAEE